MSMSDATHPVWGIARFVVRFGGLALIMWVNSGALTQSDVSTLLMWAMLDGGIETAQVKAMKRTGTK